MQDHHMVASLMQELTGKSVSCRSQNVGRIIKRDGNPFASSQKRISRLSCSYFLQRDFAMRVANLAIISQKDPTTFRVDGRKLLEPVQLLISQGSVKVHTGWTN